MEGVPSLGNSTEKIRGGIRLSATEQRAQGRHVPLSFFGHIHEALNDPWVKPCTKAETYGERGRGVVQVFWAIIKP